MQKYLIIILLSYLFVQGIEYWLKFMNLKYMNRYGKNIPPAFKGYIDESILADKSYCLGKVAEDIRAMKRQGLLEG